jgi:CheY-like chemotaxis protein
MSAQDPASEPTRRQLEYLVELRTAELAAAKEAAEAALAAKSSFLTQLSHEIRTPMNAILGLTYIVLRDVTDPRLRSQLEKVLGSAGQLQTLLEDMLALARLEGGPVQLDRAEFMPEQLLDSIAGLVSTPAAAKALRLETEVAADVPRILAGDVGRLRQLLLNFATNAVKFTDEGEVRFAATVTEVRDDAVVVRFTVMDTGAGLSDEQRARLFRPFEHSSSDTSRRYGGAGLGLALCRRIAELLGGHLGVTSRLGHGSTFWFEAPFEVSAHGAMAALDGAAHAQPEVAPVARDAGRRVLLADDNETNLEVAATLLRMQGYEVELACDGSEAVSVAGRDPFAAILLDLQMPRLDGLEAARAIRAMPQHAATPILAMTASVFEEDRQACLAAGMNDLLAKPVDPSHLATVMQRWAPLATVQRQRASVGKSQPSLTAASPMTAGEARAQLLELQRRVGADDLSARSFFLALSPAALGDSHAELKRLLEAFDYEQAGQLLAGLLESG